MIGAPEAVDRRLTRCHPAVWVAWACLGSPADWNREAMVALAILERDRPLAAWLKRRLSLDLPPAVDAFLGDPEEPPLVVTEYLEERLAPSLLEMQAREALRKGDWDESLASFRQLAGNSVWPDVFVAKPLEWEGWIARARELRAVTTQFFHVEVRAVNPLEGRSIQLDYAFEEPRELRDFRFRASAWSTRRGDLTRGGSRGLEALDHLAIFTLPITIEGVWHPGNEETGKLRITFDDLVLGYGDARESIAVYRSGSERESGFESGEAIGVPGTFRLELSSTRLRARLPDGVTIDTEVAEPVPDFGRVGVRLSGRARLESWKIRGALHPDWVAARREKLETR